MLLVGLFFEEGVCDCQPLSGGPFFEPLSSRVRPFQPVLSHCVVVVFLRCFSHACVAIGSQDKMHLLIGCVVLYLGEGVVHLLYMVVAIAAVEKVSRCDSQFKFVTYDINERNPFIDRAELLDVVSPTFVCKDSNSFLGLCVT